MPLLDIVWLSLLVRSCVCGYGIYYFDKFVAQFAHLKVEFVVEYDIHTNTLMNKQSNFYQCLYI